MDEFKQYKICEKNLFKGLEEFDLDLKYLLFFINPLSSPDIVHTPRNLSLYLGVLALSGEYIGLMMKHYFCKVYKINIIYKVYIYHFF